MIDNQVLGKNAKLSIWLLIIAIIGLILTSILPLLVIENESPVNKDLHFNMMMLDETKNDQINSLTKDFNYIVYSYWGIIVFAVISLFGLLVNASRKLNKLSIFLVSTIFISLISSGLLIIFELLLYGKLNNSMIFSYSEIISPFHYYYITLGSGFFCLYLSAFSSYKITPSLIQEFKKKEKIPKQKKEKKVKESKKEKIKKEEKTKIKKEIEKQEPVKIPDKPPEIVKTKPKIDTDNQQEIEEWLSDEIGKIEPQSKKEGKNVEATKEASAPFSPDEKIVKEEVKQIQKQPFHETKEVQKEKSSEDLKIPDSLEKALSSAIQKKQSESQYKKFEKTNEKEVDTKEETKSEENTEKPEKKEIKVRCPSCKKIFPVKKEGGVFKIKCPYCGKEGVAK